MTTVASILCECVALAELRFRRLVKTLLRNQVTMMRFCHVRYCTLSEVRDYWRNKLDCDAQQIKWWRYKGRLLRVYHSYSYSLGRSQVQFMTRRPAIMNDVYRVFLSPPQQIAGWYFKTDQGHFLPCNLKSL
jgi:hypothetical protein